MLYVRKENTEKNKNPTDRRNQTRMFELLEEPIVYRATIAQISQW